MKRSYNRRFGSARGFSAKTDSFESSSGTSDSESVIRIELFYGGLFLHEYPRRRCWGWNPGVAGFIILCRPENLVPVNFIYTFDRGAFIVGCCGLNSFGSTAIVTRATVITLTKRVQRFAFCESVNLRLPGIPKRILRFVFLFCPLLFSLFLLIKAPFKLLFRPIILRQWPIRFVYYT